VTATIVPSVSSHVTAADAPATDASKANLAPFGIDHRTPWTTSRITGSPDPPPPYRTERIYPNVQFTHPVDIGLVPGSNRTWVVEQEGRVTLLALDPSSGETELQFDGAASIDGFRAMYGLEFHPDFPRNRSCFICYVLAEGDPHGTRISRFQVQGTDPPTIDPTSETILLEWISGGHNGGCLKFGPDGYLYVSTGDASPPSPPDIHDTGQDISDLEASILRIDVEHTTGDRPYAVPADNPFVDLPDARPEVWAYGLRNPWRMSFDRASGDLWLGDVGWQLWEMVYRIERGGNYGWSVMEGPQSVRPELPRGPTAIDPPVIAHPRSEAASVTGGYVYHGSRLPELEGAYVYGDYVTGKIWSLRYDGQQITEHRELVDTAIAIIAFHEDANGELALMDYNGGTIHRLVPNEVPPSNQEFPRTLGETGLFASVADHAPAAGVVPFSVNVEQWADGATAERLVAVPGDGSMTLLVPQERVPIGWGNFPNDTVLVKTLSLELERGNPASRRRVETQILHMPGKESWRDNPGEWYGYSYVWNDEQTEATLAPLEGLDLDFSVTDADAPGGSRKHRWHIGSRTECYMCHNPWTGYRLAFTTPQLEKIHDYGTVHADQLATLEHIGVLTPGDEAVVGQGGTNGAALDQTPFVNPYDESADLAARARSYLHVNCAHCHRFGGGGTATIDLRHEATLDEMLAIGVRPTQGTFNLYDARIVAPGDPYRSLLYYRAAKLGRGRMPYIGSQQVDDAGVELLAEWIRKMPPRRNTAVESHRSEQRALLQILQTSPATSAEDQSAAIDRLLASISGALILSEAVGHHRIDASLAKTIVDHATAYPLPQVRDLFERYLPDDQRVARLGSVIRRDEILTLTGRADEGRLLFLNTAGVECKNCHRIGEVGKTIGPDLSEIGKKLTRDQLLESVVEPSKAIDPKYVAYVMETTDGRVLSGLVAERAASHVVLRDAQDRLTVVATENIEHLAPQPTSMMPELLYRDMTAQQLADLIEYLSSLR